MNAAAILERLLTRQSLDSGEAEIVMQRMVGGEFTDIQVAGILAALRAKGVASGELEGFARALFREAMTVPVDGTNLVDTCGTGGGTGSFNISTGAAIIAASAGAQIAKHGNRAVTSQCGSADVLEHLGVRLGLDPEKAAHVLESCGIVFLFAPSHHPALKRFADVRKELGVRTVFNQLGPLANPAGASRQLIGVYSPKMLEPMAEALRSLGRIGYVVHGTDGLDEVSPCAPTFYAFADPTGVTEGKFTPDDFGIEGLPESALAGSESVAANAEILLDALRGSDMARTEACVPSAAIALVLAGKAASPFGGAELAREAVLSGKAHSKLQQLIEVSSG